MMVPDHNLVTGGSPHAAGHLAVGSKVFATLQAQAALRGISVDETDDRGTPASIVRRWSCSFQCASLDEVNGLLRQMGVAL